MATTLPAMRGKFGEHEYYLCSMKANELVRCVQIPSELKEWRSDSIEERYQRKLNNNRIRREIAPYLGKAERFFGAIVAAVTEFDENVRFTPLDDLIGSGKGKISEGDKLGELWLRGGQMMVPLDGQHRVKALKFAIEGKDENGKEIPNVTASAEVANDDVAVLLVRFDIKTARQIFKDVNRYARAVDRAGAMVTDDSDLFAWFARKIANEIITPRLVNIESSTLSARDPAFTSLSTLWNTVESIINMSFPSGNVKPTDEPRNEAAHLYWLKILEVWQTVADHIPEFKAIFADKTEKGDARRLELRKTSLLGKPVGQEVLIRAYLGLTGAPTNLTPQKCCKRLAQLPWGIDEQGAEFWQGTIWTGSHNKGKVVTSTYKKKLAARIASHACGEKLTNEEKKQLLEDYRREFEARLRPEKLPG